MENEVIYETYTDQEIILYEIIVMPSQLVRDNGRPWLVEFTITNVNASNNTVFGAVDACEEIYWHYGDTNCFGASSLLEMRQLQEATYKAVELALRMAQGT